MSWLVFMYVCTFECEWERIHKWTTHRQNAAKWRKIFHTECETKSAREENFSVKSHQINKWNLKWFANFYRISIATSLCRIYCDQFTKPCTQMRMYVDMTIDRIDDGVFYTWRGVRYQSLFDMITSFFFLSLQLFSFCIFAHTLVLSVVTRSLNRSIVEGRNNWFYVRCIYAHTYVTV